MIEGRYVVLGLAHARSTWFRAVAAWCHSASIPVEFVKCASTIELRAHLASGRSFSALLVDGGVPAVDRDLIDRARAVGCAVVVVDDVRVHRDWGSLGASAVINPVFERQDLLDVLAEHAREVQRADDVPGQDPHLGPAGRTGRVAVVCGAGGTGTSTVSIALAQGLAAGAMGGGSVVLADLALHGDQAMLHDARDVVPGIQELVEAHRTRRPLPEELHTFTFDIRERGYHLLLGLRRSRDWPAIRPRAFASSFDSLVGHWQAVVCDTDALFEGEHDTGSIDVEERHVMSRTAAARADVVFAVGLPGMKGLHSLVRVIGDLLDHGVAVERIVPVCNRAPKGGRARAELSASLHALIRARAGTADLATPMFLAERRVDDALRDGVALPTALSEPVAGAFAAALTRAGPARRAVDEAQRVEPGTLGHWSARLDAEPA